MNLGRITSLAAFAAVLILSFPASADIVEVDGIVTMEHGGPFTLAPCGTEPIPTIEIYVWAVITGEPIELVEEDIWLEADDALQFCLGEVFPDSSTYAPDPGHTTMSGVIHGGAFTGVDCDAIGAQVFALGWAIGDPLVFGANSPDLNGDLEVNLADFARFGDLFHSDNACANYNESTVSPLVDVADFGIFASFFNDCECP